MQFKNIEVMNFANALRGMRNPKESYHKSDTHEAVVAYDVTQGPSADTILGWGRHARLKAIQPNRQTIHNWDPHGTHSVEIGLCDLKLAQTLIRAGTEHRKFMRQIFVSVDITAPLYWWKEFDTYKVGTVANSTSTMHTIQKKEITMQSFEIDDLDLLDGAVSDNVEPFIAFLEELRLKYNDTGDKRYWKELIRWCPAGWQQTRTVTMNYENLLGICSRGQRRNHKLNEWSGTNNPNLVNFIQMARALPYAQELLFLDELDENKTT